MPAPDGTRQREDEMAAGRQRRRPHASRRDNADLIAPEIHVHVSHFRPAFPIMPIIDAEFEDIASEPPAKAEPGPIAPEADASSFARRMARPVSGGKTTAVKSRVRSRLFPVALAGLCATSFWIFGGHAVFARLVGGEAVAGTPLVISGVSTVDGLRVAIIDDNSRKAAAR